MLKTVMKQHNRMFQIQLHIQQMHLLMKISLQKMRQLMLLQKKLPQTTSRSLHRTFLPSQVTRLKTTILYNGLS